MKTFWKETSNENGRRIGLLSTKSGVIQTPFFMPDATRGSIRGVSSEGLSSAGLEAMVVNTYHLFLQPGTEIISKAGGIHAFMDWKGILLSDSGGYQVYSLIHKNPLMGKITEEGALFKSVLNGSKHLLTPERAIQIQFDLGVDMMVCLDDPRPNSAPEEEMKAAVSRTLRWAKRCKDEFEKQVSGRGMTEETRPLLFGVVQGGMIPELRKQCVDGLVEIDFDGYGFGARHIDADGVFLDEVVRYTASILPEDKPRFALGVGTPQDIVRFFDYGWDMFDCVIPTREGRHGRLFIWKEGAIDGKGEFYETMNINNARFRNDFSPVEKDCPCPLCQNYSRAYLHHLFSAQEPLSLQLASLHNLSFYMKLMEKLRNGE